MSGKRVHSPEEASLLKGLLCDVVASGTMLADAARQLNISWRTLAVWRREDTGFVQDLEDAELHLADVMAGRAVNAHEEIFDTKQAQVAQRGFAWAAEKLRPQRYGQHQRIDVNQKTDGNELAAILRSAIERVALAAMDGRATTVDVTPQPSARMLRRDLDTPQERHRP